MRNKLIRICESFSNERYDIPLNIQEKKLEIEIRIKETKTLMKVTRGEIRTCLERIVHSTSEGNSTSLLENHKWFVKKEKGLYIILNMLKLEKNHFKGICWCPLEKEGEVHMLINHLLQSRNIVAPRFIEIEEHELEPPTYFRTNQFLYPFTEFVHTYGIPKYTEVNPTLFTIITFPFLFGIMFGDACHGSILLCISMGGWGVFDFVF